MQRLPVAAPSSSFPSPSTICGTMPKNGCVAEPGLSGVAPGKGVINMPPVSVCHQVSTTGQRSIPGGRDRKSTRLNSSHQIISYAVFCLKKKKKERKDLEM